MSSKPMTESHKFIINKNLTKFQNFLKVTIDLLNILSEDYTLTKEMREEIEVMLNCLFHF